MKQSKHDSEFDPALLEEAFWKGYYSFGEDVAFWKGYYSYGEGVSVLENPYRQDEDEVEFFEAWQSGWSAAAWDD